MQNNGILNMQLKMLLVVSYWNLEINLNEVK